MFFVPKPNQSISTALSQQKIGMYNFNTSVVHRNVLHTANIYPGDGLGKRYSLTCGNP